MGGWPQANLQRFAWVTVVESRLRSSVKRARYGAEIIVAVRAGVVAPYASAGAFLVTAAS
jgi:hypothetical protein